MLSDIFKPFIEASPLSVMMRGLIYKPCGALQRVTTMWRVTFTVTCAGYNATPAGPDNTANG